MNKIYVACLIFSLALLLINFLTTGLSDLLDALISFDFGSLDGGSDLLSGLLPLSPLEACAFLLGFGGMGLATYQSFKWHLVLALLTGLILCWATKALLRYLKKIDSSTLTDLDLIGLEGTVVVTIFKDSVGSVSLNTKVGKITYSAKSKQTISQGTKVKVIDMVGHTLIVSSNLNAPLLTPESTVDIKDYINNEK